MNKNKMLIFVTVAFLIAAYLLSGKNTIKEKGLLNPSETTSKQATISAPAATPQSPKVFQFDSSTDLNAELEKVNTEVLDSDFN